MRYIKVFCFLIEPVKIQCNISSVTLFSKLDCHSKRTLLDPGALLHHRPACSHRSVCQCSLPHWCLVVYHRQRLKLWLWLLGFSPNQSSGEVFLKVTTQPGPSPELDKPCAANKLTQQSQTRAPFLNYSAVRAERRWDEEHENVWLESFTQKSTVQQGSERNYKYWHFEWYAKNMLLNLIDSVWIIWGVLSVFILIWISSFFFF